MRIDVALEECAPLRLNHQRIGLLENLRDVALATALGDQLAAGANDRVQLLEEAGVIGDPMKRGGRDDAIDLSITKV